MVATNPMGHPPAKRPFLTIGHSSRPSSTFVDLLRAAGIEFVADIRAVPRSHVFPHFNAEALARKLGEAGLAYEHIPALGGLRKKSRTVPGEVNGLWLNQRFHNYADYALSDEFQAGIAKLRRIGHESNCAVMCAEAVWWRCHRRIVADHLIVAGELVFHVVGRKRIARAELTRGAKVHQDGTITYPSAKDGQARMAAIGNTRTLLALAEHP